ncbi:MAG TPA: gas vesicle protein GvpJ [Vicinamibacterales bacterium]|nr:gas vesicle protein GvpJ [Vicinamibacterales bacterium]
MAVARAKAAARAPRRKSRRARVDAARVSSQSLLDVIDTVIDKGLAVDAEVVLGLADIDLIYLRAGVLLAAADRVFGETPKGRRRIATSRAASASGPMQSMPMASQRNSVHAPVGARDLDTVPAARAALTSDDTSRSVIRLVLTLVEFVRQLLERQAVRRVREQTLDADEIERLGTALMRLETTVHELAERHDIDPADLNLDLGPLGTLR